MAALLWLFTGLVALALPGQPAQAEARLTHYLGKVKPGDLVPGADRFGTPDGTPPIIAAYQGDKRLGYVYLNTDFVGAAGYSGKPIRILVGVDTTGTVTGAKLVEHHEPIVLIGIPQRKIEGFLAGYRGFNPLKPVAAGGGAPQVDIVSGATVTVMV
ncbi:MAG TPA: FMN-binding protein, partial [Alphaproteobacteria bacterium]|nr:FMN-binding protein [Alphaproteobacteria bacterium]